MAIIECLRRANSRMMIGISRCRVAEAFPAAPSAATLTKFAHEDHVFSRGYQAV